MRDGWKDSGQWDGGGKVGPWEDTVTHSLHSSHLPEQEQEQEQGQEKDQEQEQE